MAPGPLRRSSASASSSRPSRSRSTARPIRSRHAWRPRADPPRRRRASILTHRTAGVAGAAGHRRTASSRSSSTARRSTLGLRHQRPAPAPPARQRGAHPAGLRRVRPRGDLSAARSTPTSPCSGCSATQSPRRRQSRPAELLARALDAEAAEEPGPAPSTSSATASRRRSQRWARLPRPPAPTPSSGRRLATASSTPQDYYRQLLRLVYRLLFLFVAEDRDLLLDPKADQPTAATRYRRFYSTARLRRLAERRRAARHADLYAGSAWSSRPSAPTTAAPRSACRRSAASCGSRTPSPDLDAAELANGDLLDAVRALATIEDDGTSAAPVDYRNLGAEELGSRLRVAPRAAPASSTPTPATFTLDDRRRPRAQDDRQLLHPVRA